MIVVVNERRVEVEEQTTVAALLQSLGFPDRASRWHWTWRCCHDLTGRQSFPKVIDSRW
ncbi:putative thiamine biosynthesis protein ThiS [Mycobacterium ulcerans str. Harvey]|uniref:Thiamine biosynthesis protein ThiS n=1 Tax=Mycobacterium ulcerans str. Harvey TaxID=1299332 RepID=A0ABN0QWI7_MYCUL|nr:putative thiamine biosynthesis protein ThiS [Mycobacterium ulcerans str. Harvey]